MISGHMLDMKRTMKHIQRLDRFLRKRLTGNVLLTQLVMVFGRKGSESIGILKVILRKRTLNILGSQLIAISRHHFFASTIQVIFETINFEL